MESPREVRSFTDNQSGFELHKKGGQTVLSLSKLADIPIELHRQLAADATIKEVTLKKEKTGEWFAIFGIEMGGDQPAKSSLDNINVDEMVGIDVDILKYAHDTDGTAVDSLDLSAERRRLEREHRKLSRKEHGSANWEKQRRTVAACHRRLKRTRRDFLRKLSTYYAREYELVAVGDLDVKGRLESPRNDRNTASSGWDTFTSLLEYSCKREGTHFVAVEPDGTTSECAACGVETEKPPWMREHSCPACVFEANRDANAARNILSRGLADLGVGHSEGTPVETALPTDTAVVSAQRVVEAGAPASRDEHQRASSQG